MPTRARMKRESVEDLGERGIELRPIPGVVGYAAGSDGQIFSFRIKGQWRKRYSPTCRPMVGGVMPNGYKHVILHWLGRRTASVHRLVASSFHGPCPNGMQCSHLNGDRSDNRPDNLRWETAKRNIGRKEGHGTMARGEMIGNSKLTEDLVRNIRRMHKSGSSYRGLAKIHGVSKFCVQQVVRGRTWRHLLSGEDE